MVGFPTLHIEFSAIGEAEKLQGAINMLLPYGNRELEFR